MKYLKMILPMLAMIFAIGLTFATVNTEPEPKQQSHDYVLINGSWRAIDEQPCENGAETCQVQFGENGPIYDVYDEMDTSTLKVSDSNTPFIIEPLF